MLVSLLTNHAMDSMMCLVAKVYSASKNQFKLTKVLSISVNVCHFIKKEKNVQIYLLEKLRCIDANQDTNVQE